MLLSPPEDFSLVESSIYRSSLPHSSNFPFLRLLNLRTILLLSSSIPSPSLQSFLYSTTIEFIHLPPSTWTIQHQTIIKALALIINRDYHPILCIGSVQETGTLFGCLRRVQGWNLNSVLVEYRAFVGGRKARFGDEQFVELFDVGKVNWPERVCEWFEVEKRLEEERELVVL